MQEIRCVVSLSSEGPESYGHLQPIHLHASGTHALPLVQGQHACYCGTHRRCGRVHAASLLAPLQRGHADHGTLHQQQHRRWVNLESFNNEVVTMNGPMERRLHFSWKETKKMNLEDKFCDFNIFLALSVAHVA